MTDDTARFVQFSHPGPEHNPKSDAMPWNVGDHRRKFLHGSGRFVDGEDREDSADLVFWGEWEPPSRIEHRWPPDDGKPRALHQPYWSRPAPSWRRQNTDPWIFGTQMLYSNCRQGVKSMRSLPPGSVICFGSTLKGRFVLDTVFVIASAQPWAPAATDHLDVDEAFKVCTAESITAGGTSCVSCGGPKADAGTASVNGLDVASDAAHVRGAISLTGQFAAVDEIPADLPAVHQLRVRAHRHHARPRALVRREPAP